MTAFFAARMQYTGMEGFPMEMKGVVFSDLTQAQEELLKTFEKEFIDKTGRALYLLAFDKKD